MPQPKSLPQQNTSIGALMGAGMAAAELFEERTLPEQLRWVADRLCGDEALAYHNQYGLGLILSVIADDLEQPYQCARESEPITPDPRISTDISARGIEGEKA